MIKTFKESDDNYGWRRIKKEIFDKEGITISRRLIRRIMRKNNLFSSYQTAYYKHYSKKPGVNRANTINELNREFDNHEKHHVIVSDLTYIKVRNKWNYLCFIIDLYNREIIGYSVGVKKDASLVTEAFMNIDFSLEEIEMFHTDRGLEFANKKIDDILSAFKIKRSLSNPGVPYDNAVSESTYQKTKIEFVRKRNFDSIEELKRETFSYVWWYNHKRLHSSLGYMSPINYRLNLTNQNCLI